MHVHAICIAVPAAILTTFLYYSAMYESRRGPDSYHLGFFYLPIDFDHFPFHTHTRTCTVNPFMQVLNFGEGGRSRERECVCFILCK